MRPKIIVCATDFSDCSRAAARRAQLLTPPGGEWVLAHVFDPRVGESLRGPAGEARLAEERNAVELRLHGECEELARTGPAPRALLATGDPSVELAGIARTEAADLLVVGSHGKTGLTRLVLGSVAEKTARASDLPVLIARGPAQRPFMRALVATDFGPAAERALELAISLVGPDAVVDVVNAVAIPIFVAAPLHAVATQALGDSMLSSQRRGADLAAKFTRSGVTVRFTAEVGDAREVVLSRLEQHPYDLLAAGTQTRHGADRFLLGSVSSALVRHAKCSVLVTR